MLAEDPHATIQRIADEAGWCALRTLINEMAAIIQRYPVLAVTADWQPTPGEKYRPFPPPPARRMHQAVFALVKRGQQEGVLRNDLPPELLPQAITGTLHIVSRFARSLRADSDMLGAQVAELLLNGFAASPGTSETHDDSGQIAKPAT